jgi:ParB-like chromosome segregation protein Spo0J
MILGFPQRAVASLPVNDLIETEEHCTKNAIELAEKIVKSEFWTVPIAAESSMMTIMDVHHRFNAAKYLGLARVPCVLI